MTIDWWTLGLQTVNVLILIWLLGRFFWRPVAAMIEQRRAADARILAEAEAKRNQATAAFADIERTRTGLCGEREAILAAAHEAAERARPRVWKRQRSRRLPWKRPREQRSRRRGRRPTRHAPNGQAALLSKLQSAWPPGWTVRRCV